MGYTVKVVTKSDEHYQFRVVGISEYKIIGDGIRICFDDIKSIEQRNLTDGGKQAKRMVAHALDSDNWHPEVAFLIGLF